MASSVHISGDNYRTMAEYDSAQQSLDPAKRDGWFMRLLVRRSR